MLPRSVRRISLILGAALLAACTGPEGPVGPQGPEGPQGPQGPAGTVTRATFFAVIDATGYAEQGLPLAYGTDPGTPPNLSCYITEVRNEGAWQQVSDGFSTGVRTVCGLIFDEGRWFALIIDGPPGWTVAFAATAP